jgi:hypothetical protein
MTSIDLIQIGTVNYSSSKTYLELTVDCRDRPISRERSASCEERDLAGHKTNRNVDQDRIDDHPLSQTFSIRLP